MGWIQTFHGHVGRAVYTYVRSYARFADDEVLRRPLYAHGNRNTTPPGKWALHSSNCAMKTPIVPVNRLPAISRTALRTAVSVAGADGPRRCDKASGLEFDDDTPQGRSRSPRLQIALHGSTGRRHGGHHGRRRGDAGQRPLRRILQTLVVEDTSGGIDTWTPRNSTSTTWSARRSHDPLQRAVPVRLRRCTAGTRPRTDMPGLGSDTPGGGGSCTCGGKQAETSPARTLTFEVDMRHTDTYGFEGHGSVQQGNWC